MNEHPSCNVLAEAEAITHPNLALIKYWGKYKPFYVSAKHCQQRPFKYANRPATPSLGVALEALHSHTKVQICASHDNEESVLMLNSQQQSSERLTVLIAYLNQRLKQKVHLHVESHNDFATAAGLASSSSGLAGVVLASLKALGNLTGEEQIDYRFASKLSRVGSGSAARAVYGGFCEFGEKSSYATPLYDESFWPELRVVVVQLESGKKSISSRDAMNLSRTTSPLYQQWLKHSPVLMQEARLCLQDKNLGALGSLMSTSYQMMFSTMLTSMPPTYYWVEDSLRLLKSLQIWRRDGLEAWETMDAGPQVKIIVLENQLEELRSLLANNFPQATLYCSKVASSPQVKLLTI